VNVCMTRPKNGPIWSNISGSTGPIFAIFTPYESDVRADNGSVAFFPIYQGTLPWQSNNIVKMYQRRLILPAFGALELENKLQYHGLAMCVNSAYDACISCENFVKFRPVTPELTGLICERQV